MAIDIFDYTDFLKYFSGWFDDKKVRTVRSFAKRAGCSAALVSEVRAGRRPLQAKWIDPFKHALRLTPREGTYFEMMVAYTQARSDERRQELLHRMTERARFEKNSRREANVRSYSTWYISAVAELAQCEGFQLDAEWIAATLVPNISVEQAEEAIETLLQIKRLVIDDNGQVVADPEPHVTGHMEDGEELSRGLAAWQQDILKLAASALMDVPGEERHMTMLTMPLSEKAAALARARIEGFLESIIALAEDDSDPVKVHQLAVLMFPLSSRPTGDPEDA